MEPEHLDEVKVLEFDRTIQVVETEGIKTVLLKGQPYMSWSAGDESSERMAIAQLYELGMGTQDELAEAFTIHVNSVSKYAASFKREGSDGLRSGQRGPKQSWKVVPDVRGKILWIVMKEGMREYAEIQERLEKQWNKKVSLESIRQVLLDNGLVEERIKQEPQGQRDLFNGGEGDELALSLETTPAVCGSCAQLDDQNEEVSDLSLGGNKRKRSDYGRAERKYVDELERGLWSAYAGGLLFVPLIERYHFSEIIKRVIDMPTYEGYSLQQLCLTLFYFDVFEFRSIEDFKTVYPEEYGALIGKASSPSIYTLRRFLHRVRELKQGEELIDEFGKEYLRLGLVRWGVMYIDSHFLPYYGMRVITMGWHGVQDKAQKGSYQFLAVDEKFNPFLFLLRPSSEDLLEKIPELIEKARKLGREIGIAVEDLTVIFDREGYSAGLFRKLDPAFRAS